jgi:hypothetical protein
MAAEEAFPTFICFPPNIALLKLSTCVVEFSLLVAINSSISALNSAINCFHSLVSLDLLKSLKSQE